MAQGKHSSQYSHGDRLRMSYRMTPRQRRHWITKAVEAQDALEKAVEMRDRALAQAWSAGLSYAALGGVVGVHAETVKGFVELGLALEAGTEETGD